MEMGKCQFSVCKTYKNTPLCHASGLGTCAGVGGTVDVLASPPCHSAGEV